MTTHFVQLMDILRRRSLRMASAVEDMLQESAEALVHADHALARRIVDRDEEIDQEEVAIEEETLRLMTLFQPMGSDMRQLCTILKVNSDLERIADCTVNIAERTRYLDAEAIRRVGGDLSQMYPIVRGMLHEAIRAYSTGDRDIAGKVRSQDSAIDALYGRFIQRMVNGAARSPEIMAAHLDVLSIAKNLERIADHATNIAEDVIYLATGQIVRHRGE